MSAPNERGGRPAGTGPAGAEPAGAGLVRLRAVRLGAVRSARGRSGPVRSASALAGSALAMTSLLAGCGIRTTTVPVDAGPAPSRVSCLAPEATAEPRAETVPRQVFLVCSMQIAPVTRNVPVREGRIDWHTQVRDLFAQLQITPQPGETGAGFSTAIPGSLWVLPVDKHDPKTAVRISQPPGELPSFALAELVCTLGADKQITPDGQVVLGGPTPSHLRAYTCTPGLRTDPDAADTAGTPVSERPEP